MLSKIRVETKVAFTFFLPCIRINSLFSEMKEQRMILDQVYQLISQKDATTTLNDD